MEEIPWDYWYNKLEEKKKYFSFSGDFSKFSDKTSFYSFNICEQKVWLQELDIYIYTYIKAI